MSNAPRLFNRLLSRLLLSAACAAAPWLPAQAAPLYANFVPTSATPDYSSTQYADISAYCSSVYCSFINMFSASFTFSPVASGRAAHGYLPLQAIATAPGMERFFRLSILNRQGEVVVQGGKLGRDVPLGAMNVHDFDLNRDYEAGQVLALSDQLLAGEVYTAVFTQRFGSMSQTHWMSSGDPAAAGQATASCSPNVPGSCAWATANGWSPVFPTGSSASLAFLPALALADAAGFTPAPPGTVPEPATAALALLALAGALCRRRRSD